MNYETLRYESDGHVTVLTYDRPEQRNAVSRQMNQELHHAWQRFRDDPDAFVLVITGEGEAFCAGWDLEDAAELGEGEPPDWDAFRTRVWNPVWTAPRGAAGGGATRTRPAARRVELDPQAGEHLAQRRFSSTAPRPS